MEPGSGEWVIVTKTSPLSFVLVSEFQKFNFTLFAGNFVQKKNENENATTHVSSPHASFLFVINKKNK